MYMIELFSATVFIMLASLGGVISIWKGAGSFVKKNLSFLVSFSAGVFLIITFELLRETFEHSSIVMALLSFLGGLALIHTAFLFLPEFHHHHDEENEKHTHNKIDARRILLGDGIHNIGDGILLASAFSTDIRLGFFTAGAVLIHELVQEISEFFVLKQAGLSTRKALIYNFLVSGTILLGVLLGSFLVESIEVLKVPLLGITAGSFFYVVVKDLIPHSIRHGYATKNYLHHIIWFIAGIALMTALNVSFGHEHAEDSLETLGYFTDTAYQEKYLLVSLQPPLASHL